SSCSQNAWACGSIRRQLRRGDICCSQSWAAWVSDISCFAIFPTREAVEYRRPKLRCSTRRPHSVSRYGAAFAGIVRAPMTSVLMIFLPVVSRADVHKLEGVVTLRDVLDSYGVSEGVAPRHNAVSSA